MDVNLIAPKYILYGDTASLTCAHKVSNELLHKIEFVKNERRIFEYVKERKPPYIPEKPVLVDGAKMEYAKNGSSIKLHNVGFETSGVYSCEVTMETPIYTSVSDPVEIKVILPQMEQPTITFKKSVFTMGEILEANCTTAPAYPVPHITWLINDEEADIGSVIHLPHTSLVNTKSMYATAELKVKLTPSMLGRKLNYLNLRCQATIPAYSSQRRYADIREIAISVPVISSSASSARRRYKHRILLYILLFMIIRLLV
ncbi:PREDICTED: nectin-3-like [Cyphomyrmex costatus]|uniref:nectin-3-like n=1 Tax=Cyphomyrmex costatus TaxID=456900 RepID=UPI000852404C|nr:PREDICTED: nectin-3-like [Cyphomyrmex costatus]